MKGHIRERSPGRWAIVIDIRDAQTGKRRRRWHSFAGTKRQAQVECARLIAEAQHGGSVEPSKITVAEYLDRFERDWIATHVTARSGIGYRGALMHVRKCLGERKLQKLAPADLLALYASLHRDGLAPRSIKLIHVVLHRALAQAKLLGMIRDNPAEIAKPPKVKPTETEMLQPKEAAHLLERLGGKPLYLFASLALATGARRNELLALTWGDLDLDKAQLTIARALEQLKADDIRIKSPKTTFSKRTISLPSHTVTELRRHWRETQECRLKLGLGRASDDAPVFAKHDGKHMSPDAVTQAWIRQMDALGMPHVTLHSLRHTHASMLIKGGVDVITVSRRLGHASPTITLNVYGHLVTGGDDRAVEIVSAAFGKIG
jgi:integrase